MEKSLIKMMGSLPRFIKSFGMKEKEMDEKEPKSLIVMRLADAHKYHPNQIIRKCQGGCNEPVIIYPSGQVAMKKFPNMKIICTHCTDWGKALDQSNTMIPAGSIDVIEQEKKDSFNVKK